LLLVAPERAAALDREAAAWPEIALTGAELSELELRLSVPGIPLPPLRPTAPPGVEVGHRVALRDTEGVLLATLAVETVEPADADAAVQGTHLAQGTHTAQEARTVRGTLTGVRLPAHPDAADLRRTPAALVDAVRRRGWTTVHAVLTDGPLFEADLARLAAQLDGTAGSPRADGAVVALLAGGVDATDPEHHARLAALRAGLDALPEGRTLLTVLPVPPTASPDRRSEVAQAYGLTALEPVGASPDVVSAPGSPGAADVRGALGRSDAELPPGLGPAGVVAALRRTTRPRTEQGLTVFFTGLSGSGKSTVAGLLTVRLLEQSSRSVLLLDGDKVRRHLTKGLGFSQADRDTNVARIGWVAAQVSAAGGIAVCAPIAPYDATRKQVRALVEGISPASGFVLVHVATPLEECARRDRKGLYARAFAGDLPGFTGVSDPYEEPADAEVVVDTTGRPPDQVVDDIVAFLADAGYLTASAGAVTTP
jgi:sulfate adenylyltransferase